MELHNGHVNRQNSQHEDPDVCIERAIAFHPEITATTTRPIAPMAGHRETDCFLVALSARKHVETWVAEDVGT